MVSNLEMISRLNRLKFKSEEELEEILQEDLQEIIDLRETISIYEIKKERFEVLQTEKKEILRLLNREKNQNGN